MSQTEASHTQDEGVEQHRLTLHVGFGWCGAVVCKVLQDGGVPGEAQQHLGKDGPVSDFMFSTKRHICSRSVVKEDILQLKKLLFQPLQRNESLLFFQT